MRGILWFVHTSHDVAICHRLKLTDLFPNEKFSGEKDSGKVLIIIIILFLIILIIFFLRGWGGGLLSEFYGMLLVYLLSLVLLLLLLLQCQGLRHSDNQSPPEHM